MNSNYLNFVLYLFIAIGTSTGIRDLRTRSKRCICLKITKNCPCSPVNFQPYQPVYNAPVQPTPCVSNCVQNCIQAQYSRCEQACANTCNVPQQYEPPTPSYVPEPTTTTTTTTTTPEPVIEYQPPVYQQPSCAASCMPSCSPQCVQQPVPVFPSYYPAPAPAQYKITICIKDCMPSCTPQCVQQSAPAPAPIPFIPPYAPGPVIVQPPVIPQVPQIEAGCTQACRPSCSQPCIEQAPPVPVIEQTTPVPVVQQPEPVPVVPEPEPVPVVQQPIPVPVVQQPVPIYRPQTTICVSVCMPACDNECIFRASPYYQQPNPIQFYEPAANQAPIREVNIDLPASIQQSPNCLNLCQEKCVQQCMQQTEDTSQCQSSCNFACRNQCSQYQINQYQPIQYGQSVNQQTIGCSSGMKKCS